MTGTCPGNIPPCVMGAALEPRNIGMKIFTYSMAGPTLKAL